MLRLYENDQLIALRGSRVATWGVAVADSAEGFEFKWDRTGQSSKHMMFDWTGPD